MKYCIRKALNLLIFHLTRFFERNVFQGMSQGAATTVANGHFPLHFNDGYFVDQFQSNAGQFFSFKPHNI